METAAGPFRMADQRATPIPQKALLFWIGLTKKVHPGKSRPKDKMLSRVVRLLRHGNKVVNFRGISAILLFPLTGRQLYFPASKEHNSKRQAVISL